MARLARIVVQRSPQIALLFLLITLFLGAFALRVRLETTLESVLPTNDPSVHFYESVRATFGSDEIGVVGVQADELFSEATLTKIRTLTDRIGEIDGVDEVLSITNAVDPSADAFRPPLLIPTIPLPDAAVGPLRAKLASTPLYAINLVGPEFRAAAINVFFENMTDTEYRERGVDERIEAILTEFRGPETLSYTGAAHVKRVATDQMRSDLILFTPIALALVLATFWFSFRRLRAVLLPMLVVLVALTWTLGAMALAGRAINLGTFVLPPLLLVIGSSYALHVLAYLGEQSRLVGDSREAVERTILQVARPLAISAGTTMIGFGALGLNRIPAIRDLGWFAAVGIFFLALTCLFLLPALIRLWPDSGAPDSGPAIGPQLRRPLGRLAIWAYRKRNLVLGGAAVLGLIAVLGLFRIQVDSDFLNYFDRTSQVRRDNQLINDEIVGSNPFYLVVESLDPGTIEQWDVLRKIDGLQDFLTTLPGVTGSVSLVDYLELLEQGLNTGSEDDLVLDDEGNLVPFEPPPPFWEDPASLPELINLVRDNAENFSNVVTPDFSRANILVRTTISGSKQVEGLFARIREYLAFHFPASLRVVPTGTLVLMTGTSSEIVYGQIRSLSLALVTIFVIMSMMFLSARVGILAILPNALAILVFFGILGWVGVDLNLGTSLIATIALGIAVDSTIHFMTRLSHDLGTTDDEAHALKTTLASVGIPVVLTSVGLILGFLTFTGSSFVPIRSFGWLTATTLTAALLANLVLLPALLATTKIITLWDLVSLKIGDDPTTTIPLLFGLRPSQARIVVLMGQLRCFEPGDVIVRSGDLGDEMFVIVDGKVDVWAVGEGRDEREYIWSLSRGAVFGEMALLSQNPRSADVTASGPVEVLAIDRLFVERLRRRYPRLAGKVLVNLTKVLSDRLDQMTRRVFET